MSGPLALLICGGDSDVRVNITHQKQHLCMSHLINNVTEKISENEDIDMAVSAIVMPNQIGYPKRIVDPEGESRDGEHRNFDEAYDYACSLLGVDEVKVDREKEYVWFTTS